MNLDDFKQLPIMGILRGIPDNRLEELIRTIIEAGLKTIEIAVNKGDALDQIRRVVRCARGRLTVGAGTVLTVESARAVLEAGATFIVSPVYVSQVVEFCCARSIPVFPGALTPQEIYQAWQGGATMVKVFPAKMLGPGYFKEIKGPFGDIPLLACGGVTADTIGDYFLNRASAAAFGASIFKSHWLENSCFDEIGSSLQELLAAYAESATKHSCLKTAAP